MVKKPVAKKEKKKSARQLQVELNKKRLEAFNSAVAGVTHNQGGSGVGGGQH